MHFGAEAQIFILQKIIGHLQLKSGESVLLSLLLTLKEVGGSRLG